MLQVNLVDSSVVLNNTGNQIDFIAVANGDNIEIHYRHNFSNDITFSTNTIHWIDLLPPN